MEGGNDQRTLIFCLFVLYFLKPLKFDEDLPKCKFLPGKGKKAFHVRKKLGKVTLPPEKYSSYATERNP